MKGQSIFHNDAGINISIDNEPVKLEKTVVYYVDEIAPEFSMQSLTAGVVAVIVVVVIAVVAAIVVLVSSNKAAKQNGTGTIWEATIYMFGLRWKVFLCKLACFFRLGRREIGDGHTVTVSGYS